MADKGPSQKYLEANEVKYFSLGGGGRRFHGHYFTFSKEIGFMLVFYHHRMKPKVGRNFTSERGEGVKGEVANISLHWLQGIFETVPKYYIYNAGAATQSKLRQYFPCTCPCRPPHLNPPMLL